MSLCINPKCPRPDHPGNDHNRYCASCGSDLLLNDRYRVLRLLSDKTGFGKIYETYERATPKILKVLKEDWNTSSKVVALFEQEARVLGKLEHLGILTQFSQLRLVQMDKRSSVVVKITPSKSGGWIKAIG